MGQTTSKQRAKGHKRNEQTHRANKRAREETSGLIDPRLRKALSHELRVQILTVANQRELSPSEFSDEFDVPLANVSYHFRKLLEYDCIELTREDATVAEFRAGKIVRIGYYNDQAQALAAAGLAK